MAAMVALVRTEQKRKDCYRGAEMRRVREEVKASVG